MPNIIHTDNGAYLEGKNGSPIHLSGGFGSEVNKITSRQGIKDSSIKKGSRFIAPIHTPQVVRQVHESYADAGAEILTADTFCASISRQNGNIKLVKEFINSAAAIAQDVSMQHPQHPLVALSLTSSGDCYAPEDTPDKETLIAEHEKNIALLKPFGDFILAETLPTLREGQVIADLSQKAEKPFFASFTVNEQGRILDGSNMIDVVDVVLNPNTYCLGVGVNCCSVEGAKRAVSELGKIFSQSANLTRKHIIAYPNGFAKSLEENNKLAENGHHHPEIFSPDQLATILGDLVDRGATVIGGCCGSSPAHTQEYSKLSLVAF